MIITAMLKRYSRIWRMWRSHDRLGGQLGGTMFKWVPGDDYATGPLVREEIAHLRKRHDVQLELSGVDLQFEDPPTPTPFPTPTPAPVDVAEGASQRDAVANAVDAAPEVSNSPKQTPVSPPAAVAVEAALSPKPTTLSLNPQTAAKLPHSTASQPPVPAFVRRAQQRSSSR